MSFVRAIAIALPSLFFSHAVLAEWRYPTPPAAPFVVPESIELQVRCDKKIEKRLFRQASKNGPVEMRTAAPCPHVFATEKNNGIVLEEKNGRLRIGVSEIGSDLWRVIEVNIGKPVDLGGDVLAVEDWVPGEKDNVSSISE